MGKRDTVRRREAKELVTGCARRPRAADMPMVGREAPIRSSTGMDRPANGPGNCEFTGTSNAHGKTGVEIERIRGFTGKRRISGTAAFLWPRQGC